MKLFISLGKTAAFMLPVLERLVYKPRTSQVTRVLVLVPTRELGIQVHSVARQLAQFTSITTCLAVGMTICWVFVYWQCLWKHARLSGLGPTLESENNACFFHRLSVASQSRLSAPWRILAISIFDGKGQRPLQTVQIEPGRKSETGLAWCIQSTFKIKNLVSTQDLQQNKICNITSKHI